MHISAEGRLAEGLRDLMGQRVESLVVSTQSDDPQLL